MPKEKEPLLTELEIVGRLPLSQLSTGVRRSRSWYLCCPNLEEEELSRESSWRYSSLRPVTAPPQAVRIMTSQRPDSYVAELTSVRAERDSLRRALTAERQRAASVAAAQDARLAELHGVIAELLRRRTLDKQSDTILEEDSDGSVASDSTTQAPDGGEMDNDESIDRHDEETSQLSALDLSTPDTHNMRVSEVTAECESSIEVPPTPPSGTNDLNSPINHKLRCTGARLTVRGALVSADRALECYDSILALWETRHLTQHQHERAIAEAVASQLLHRLESNEEPSHLLSPGPWLDTSLSEEVLPFSETVEARLRQHAARLKAETVASREGLLGDTLATCHCALQADTHHVDDNDVNDEDKETTRPSSSRRDPNKHWIETQETSETDL